MPRNKGGRKLRHGPGLKTQVGLWLMSRERTRGPDRTALAEALGVSVRTLWNWAHREPKKIGRPPAAPEVRLLALSETKREWEKQGYTSGWRPLRISLGSSVPLRLIQSSLSLLKAESRARTDRRRKIHRRGFQVQAKGAVLRQDSTHLAGKAWAEVLQDAATRELLAVQVGKSIQAQGVIALLEALKTKGLLPLVLQTDNGSAYTSQVVQQYLAKEQVVHLRSRVHTPTDNAGAERAIRDLKAEADLACAGPHKSPQQAQVRIAEATEKLNTARRRACLGFKTPLEASLEKPRWYTRVNRADFFQAVQVRMTEAKAQGGSARQQRSAERQAVIETLERYGLAVQTRGGWPLATVKPETLS